MPLRAPGPSGDVLILQRPYEKRSGSEGFVRSIATFSAPPGPRPAHNRPCDTSCSGRRSRSRCVRRRLHRRSRTCRSRRESWPPPAERTPTPSVGNQAGWNVDSRRVVAVVPIADVPGDLVCPTNPVPQQMPWSRHWTARGGGHRLNLLARLPKGWQMRDVDRTRRQAAARCAPVVMPPPFPTDLLAGAPTLSPKPKEVNIDH